MAFNFKNKVDKDKVFIVNRNKLEKRLDPFYYIPSLMALEEKVKEQKPKPLRHYVKTIASGATPKTTEYDKYYSDKENGIPFLRVQNLSPTGVLDTEKVKYINKTTHENYLKRSQVEEGDLLVKITGVGRMAVASVAPEGFVGNTNQHMVVIKTGSKEASEVLAAYLNTDIAEALASRRATGGTRPALDYPALLSIPIINSDEILRINKKAIDSKQQKEAQAKELLEGIDDYLLEELGIIVPKYDCTLKKRIFNINYSELASNRMDSEYYSYNTKNIIKALNDGKHKLEKLNKECEFIAGYAFSSNDYLETSECLLITIKNISKNTISFKKATYLPDNFFTKYNRFQINKDDLLIAMTGATIGKVGIYKSTRKALLNQRNGIIKSNSLNTFYLMNLLNTAIFQSLILRNAVGGAQPNISEKAILNLRIPIPPLETQNELALNISNLRNKAKKLQDDANLEMKNAQKEIQQIILGTKK